METFVIKNLLKSKSIVRFLLASFIFYVNPILSQFTLIATGTTDNLMDLSIINKNIVISGTKKYMSKSYDECNHLSQISKPANTSFFNRFQRLDSNNVFLYSYSVNQTLINHSNDCGKSWLEKYNGAGSVARVFTFFDTLTGYMSDGSTLYKTINSCASFSQINSPIQSIIISIKSHSDSLICIGGLFVSGSGFRLSKNRGNSWPFGTGTFSNIYFNDYYFLNKDTIFAVTSPGGFVSTFDGGNNWPGVSIPMNDINCVSFRSANEGYIVGSNSQTLCTIAKTTDLGKTWAYFNTGISGTLYNIGFVNDSIAIVSGSNGILLRWNYKQTIFTEINELNLKELNFNIFPNPVNDKLSISLENNLSSTVTISNLMGEKIINIVSFYSPQSIDLSDLPKGVYFLKVQNEKGMAARKFIKE